MELELKYLAPYLPYKIKGFSENGTMFYLDIISNMRGKGIESREINSWINNRFRPILIPLSDFGNSDDTRKVHEFIGLGKWCDNYDDYFDAWFNDLSNVDKLILQAPFEVFTYFLFNHFDVFGLIEKGLAVSVHDVE
jgi:hypothetical protein